MLYTWDEKRVANIIIVVVFLKKPSFQQQQYPTNPRILESVYPISVWDAWEEEERGRRGGGERESKIKLLCDAHEESHKHNNNKKKTFSCSFVPFNTIHRWIHVHTVIIYIVGWVKIKKQLTNQTNKQTNKQKKKEAQAERVYVCVVVHYLKQRWDWQGVQEKKGIRKLKILKTKKKLTKIYNLETNTKYQLERD